MIRFNIKLAGIIFTALAMNLAGCSEDQATDYIPEYFKNLIPYTQDEKVIFVGNNEDTIVCTADIVVEYYTPEVCERCAERNRQEQITCNLLNLNRERIANIYISKRFSDNDVMDISLWSPLQKNSGIGFQLRFKEGTTDPWCIRPTYCYDSLTLNEKIYQSVLELPRENTNTQFTQVNKLLYSIPSGFIRFEHNDGTIYTLLES
mgnify:CR=1 FL=1